jgi:hypothetical protein
MAKKTPRRERGEEAPSGVKQEAAPVVLRPSGGFAGGGAPDAPEAEAMRQQLLAEAGDVAESPGDIDSLLDRAYLADSNFEEHVLAHPACLRSPELFREAWSVARALADFYQRVGQEAAKNAAGTAP